MRQLYEFDCYQVDFQRRLLLRGGEVVQLPSKALDTLLVLIQHRGEVVSKDELMKWVWPDSFVEEGNLSQYVHILRKALGEGVGEHRYIVTVPGRGYRFVAKVVEYPGTGKEASTETGAGDHSTTGPVEIIAASRPNAATKPEKELTEILSEIRQSLLMANSPSDLRKLHVHIETILDEHPGDSSLHEARELLYQIQRALNKTIAESATTGIAPPGVTGISKETAACVFDDAHALSRYCGLGSWVTLGNVRGQAIVVDHTVEQRHGREIIRIISARKATPAERRIYAKKS